MSSEDQQPDCAFVSPDQMPASCVPLIPLEGCPLLPFYTSFFLSFLFFHCLAAHGTLVPQPGIEPAPSAMKASNPNHGTTRGLPLPLSRSAFSLCCQETGKHIRKTLLWAQIVTRESEHTCPREDWSQARVSSSVHSQNIPVKEACTVQGRDSGRRIGVSGLRGMVVARVGRTIFTFSVATTVRGCYCPHRDQCGGYGLSRGGSKVGAIPAVWFKAVG